MITGANGTRRGEPSERLFLLVAFVIPGLTYPLWTFAAPEGSVDPPLAWVLLGLCFLSVPVVTRYAHFRRGTLKDIMSGIAALVTLHLFLLASLNDMAPFYAMGSTLAVFATMISIRTVSGVLRYGLFVATLAVTLFAVEPDDRKIAYWVGLVPVLGLSYYRLASQLAQRQRLEGEVLDRTRKLQDANRWLREEIEERKRLEKEMPVLHKMEAVGRLAGNVAHDFNNLLATIGVYADLLADNYADRDAWQDHVDQIQKAIRQAASLTQQLLTLGRRSNVQLDRIDLNQAVSNACTVLRKLLSDGVELRCDLGKDPEPILADPDQLQQVLLNLALNARDAMSTGGTLTIATSWPASSDGRSASRGAQGSLADREHALLTVSDTGCGMTSDTRERAFDPFFTTKDRDRGTGLGLSIVHGIATQAGANIRLQSELGVGTRVEIEWPLAHGLVEDATAVAEGRPTRAGGGGEEILLVEDEEPLRRALLAVLLRNGYRVTEADNGARALEIAGQRDGPFDAVVTDLVMPGMGGIELVESLAESSPETRVLLMSGHLDSDEIFDRIGDRPFLAKPFAADPLITKLREILDAPDRVDPA